jgi:2-aminoadipate transaminase
MASPRRLSQRARCFDKQPISELMRLALAQPDLVSLAAGFVDQASLPVTETQQAIQAVLGDPERGRAALQYGTNAGYLPLREAVLARMLAADGSSAARRPTVDQVLLTSGSNQLLHLVGEVLLDPGDIVLCAAPTYFVFLGLLNSLGAQAVGVAIDEQGLIPEALSETLVRLTKAGQRQRVKAIYVTSYYENPSTVSLSLERRQAVVEFAKRQAADGTLYVIDDAAYRELRYAGDDLPGLRSFDENGETVIVAETFSKSFSPGIRVGWGVLPTELIGPVSGLKASIDFGSPYLNQQLMSAVFEQGHFDPHVALLRTSYQAKLEAMLKAMDDFLTSIPGVRWYRPRGGLYVWLELPDGMNAGPGGTLIEHALAEGVLYVPGEYCYPAAGEPVHTDRIRLSFGIQSSENIRRGVESLARAIRRSL